MCTVRGRGPWGGRGWPPWPSGPWSQPGGVDPRKDSDAGRKVVGCLGGCLAAYLAMVLVSILLSLGAVVLKSPGLLFLVAWIVTGGIIYHVLCNRDRKRERPQRQPRRIEIKTADSEEEEPSEEARVTETKPAGVHGFGAGEVTLALFAGFGLALACGLALTGAAVGSTTNLVLILLLWLFGGATVYSLARRRAQQAAPGETPPDREVRAQAKRIKAKCRGLRREARRVGGVFGELEWQATELADQARELSKLLLNLRRAARDVHRALGNPPLPRGVSGDSSDDVLQREFEAAQATEERLETLVAQNSRHQQVCLAQLERIEDLVDVARLEVSQPLEPAGVSSAQGAIVEEVETELQAAREALEQVQQIEA